MSTISSCLLVLIASNSTIQGLLRVLMRRMLCGKIWYTISVLLVFRWIWKALTTLSGVWTCSHMSFVMTLIASRALYWVAHCSPGGHFDLWSHLRQRRSILQHQPPVLTRLFKWPTNRPPTVDVLSRSLISLPVDRLFVKQKQNVNLLPFV